MDMPAFELIEANGIRIAAYRTGPLPQDAKATVLFLHGFPDLAFTWRHQLHAFAEAGYAAIAVDLRGYGRSDKPQEVAAYGMDVLTSDVTGILDHYQVDRGIVVGHDWGALICWSLPFYCPDRLLVIANLNVPLIPRGLTPPLTALRHVYGPNMYIVRFQEEGVCENIFERDMARTMQFFFRAPDDRAERGGGAFSTPDLDLVSWLERPEEEWPGKPFLSADELAVYVNAFERGGMRGPLHYYRNFDANWEKMARFQPEGVPPSPVRVPALMITAALDGVCPPRLADGAEVFLSDYKRVDLEGCGHWTQQEKPDAVNRILLDWVEQKRSQAQA